MWRLVAIDVENVDRFAGYYGRTLAELRIAESALIDACNDIANAGIGVSPFVFWLIDHYKRRARQAAHELPSEQETDDEAE